MPFIFATFFTLYRFGLKIRGVEKRHNFEVKSQYSHAFINFILTPKVHAFLPQYTPVNQGMGRNEAIVNYFMLGFPAVEILGFLVSIYGFALACGS